MRFRYEEYGFWDGCRRHYDLVIWSSRRREAAESLDDERGLETEAHEMPEGHYDTNDYETEEDEDEADPGHDEVDSQGATDGDSSDTDDEPTSYANPAWADQEDGEDGDDEDDEDAYWLNRQIWSEGRRYLIAKEIDQLWGRIKKKNRIDMARAATLGYIAAKTDEHLGDREGWVPSLLGTLEQAC